MIAGVLCEPALINIDIQDFTLSGNVDVLSNTIKEIKKFKKNIKTSFEQVLNEFSNVSKVVLYVYCGAKTSLKDIFRLIKFLKKKFFKNVDIVFGAKIIENVQKIYKIDMIFQ